MDAGYNDSFLIMTGKIGNPGDGFQDHQQLSATPDQGDLLSVDVKWWM